MPPVCVIDVAFPPPKVVWTFAVPLLPVCAMPTVLPTVSVCATVALLPIADWLGVPWLIVTLFQPPPCCEIDALSM